MHPIYYVLYQTNYVDKASAIVAIYLIQEEYYHYQVCQFLKTILQARALLAHPPPLMLPFCISQNFMRFGTTSLDLPKSKMAAPCWPGKKRLWGHPGSKKRLWPRKVREPLLYAKARGENWKNKERVVLLLHSMKSIFTEISGNSKFLATVCLFLGFHLTCDTNQLCCVCTRIHTVLSQISIHLSIWKWWVMYNQ